MDKKVGLEIRKQDGSAVVAFTAPSVTDTETIAAATEGIKAFIDESQPTGLIFDFGAVKFFSSHVLGLLLEIRAKLKEYDGEVVISAIDPQLHRVFKITNLDQVFRFFPDKEAAIGAMSSEG